jgi:hypothetical protein
VSLANELCRLPEGQGDGIPDWLNLTVTDLDVLILRLRQWMVGEHIRAEATCGGPGCGQRIDIAFSISEYLAKHQPAQPALRDGWRVEPAEEVGWFRLSQAAAPEVAPDADGSTGKNEAEGKAKLNAEVYFRLPRVADQLAIAGWNDAEAARELARRCLRAPELPAGHRRRAETAMERMSPSLADQLQGTCPECGSTMSVFFDARSFCLRELRDRAAFVFEDIDLLARRYHWSEADILALPQRRRTSYTEWARQAEARN